MKDRKQTKVLYLDLDGTVRKGFDELGKFVNKAEDVEIFEGVPELMQSYRKNGWRIVGITNQGGVALGYVSLSDMLRAISTTERLCEFNFDLVMHCPHHPSSIVPANSACWCRKPKIGNLTRATFLLEQIHFECYPLDFALFVGDRPEDRECAENAGIVFMEAKEWREGGNV